MRPAALCEHAHGARHRPASRLLAFQHAAVLRRNVKDALDDYSSADCNVPRRRRRRLSCRPSRAPVSTRVSEPRCGPAAGACAASRRPPPASHPALPNPFVAQRIAFPPDRNLSIALFCSSSHRFFFNNSLVLKH